MSSTDVSEAITKLQNLSQERASKVLSIIEDLSDLEAMEDAEDLKDSRSELAEMKRMISEGAISGEVGSADEAEPAAEIPGAMAYDQLRRELGLDR